MSTDDFFKKVDETRATTAKATVAANITASENRVFLEEVVARLSPLVSEYKQKLRDRSIHAEVQTYPTGISITLRYKNGHHRALNLGGRLEDYRIEMTTSFTNDDGRNYKSTSGASYDRSNWTDILFEKELQKEISDFLFYADRHGGY